MCWSYGEGHSTRAPEATVGRGELHEDAVSDAPSYRFLKFSAAQSLAFLKVLSIEKREYNTNAQH